MSNNLDDLRKRRDDLRATLDAADRAWREAASDFDAARMKASGLLGKRMTDGRSTIIVDRISFCSWRQADDCEPFYLYGRVILKSGQIGNRETSFAFSRAKESAQ